MHQLMDWVWGGNSGGRVGASSDGLGRAYLEVLGEVAGGDGAAGVVGRAGQEVALGVVHQLVDLVLLCELGWVWMGDR